MDAALELEFAVGSMAIKAEDGFLDAANSGFIKSQDLYLPAETLGKTGVHPEQISGEKRGLVSPCPTSNFQNDVFLVVGIPREQKASEQVFVPGYGSLQLLHIRAGQFFHFCIPTGGQLSGFFQTLLAHLIISKGMDHFLKI